MPRNCIRPFLLASVLLFLSAGCEPAAHMAWSPDGAHAAYFAPMEGKLLPGCGFVLDPAGKVASDLGPTFGSFAWSSDSKSLYFAGYDNKGPAPDNTVNRKWLIDAQDQPAGEPDDKSPPMVLNRWQDGKVERLTRLGNRQVFFVFASPDQSWVAVVTMTKSSDEPGHGGFELLAFNTASKKLYAISDISGGGACFTGTDQLVYVESDRHQGIAQSTGQLTEVTLDESLEQLTRTPLVNVLWQKTSWLTPFADGLLFTTQGRTFPVKSDTPDQATSLYHYTRANGEVSVMADAADTLFMPSPDGKRILYIKISPAAGNMPEKRELAIMNANGSDSHALCDLSAYNQPPMWPTWHGSDGITFIDPKPTDLPIQPDQPPRIAFDVVDYKITDQNTLEPIRTLSQGWPIEMKASMKKENYTAAK